MPTPEEKIRDFLESLDIIDLKNADYFLFERPEITEGERDRLQNHCRFEMQGDKAVFGFFPSSALPFQIRKQCFARFEQYFPDGGIVGGVFGK